MNSPVPGDAAAQVTAIRPTPDSYWYSPAPDDEAWVMKFHYRLPAMRAQALTRAAQVQFADGWVLDLARNHWSLQPPVGTAHGDGTRQAGRKPGQHIDRDHHPWKTP